LIRRRGLSLKVGADEKLAQVCVWKRTERESVGRSKLVLVGKK
jgi:hypothetical protein